MRAEDWLDDLETVGDYAAEKIGSTIGQTPVVKAMGQVLANPTPQEVGAQVTGLAKSASNTLQESFGGDPVDTAINYGPGAIGATIHKASKSLPIWWDEFIQTGNKPNKDGSIIVYHATTKDKARLIQKDGYLKRPQDAPDSYGVYFSTSKEAAKNYGDGTIIPIKVKPEDLEIDDVFPGTNRIDFKAKTKGGIYTPISIEKAEDFLDK